MENKIKLSATRLEAGNVDREKGTIKGVSLMSVGEAKGHGVLIDKETLSGIFGLVQGGQSVKAFLNHEENPNPSDAIGIFTAIHIDGDKLRGTFQALPSFREHNAKGFDALFDLATAAPETFGVSLVIYGPRVAVEGQDLPSLRAEVLESADFVNTPAANEKGLFSIPVIESVTVIETPSKFKTMKTLYTRFSTNEKALLKAIKLAAEDDKLTEEAVIQTVEEEIKAEEKAGLETQVATLTTQVADLLKRVEEITGAKAVVDAENTELKAKLSAKGAPAIKLGVQPSEENKTLLEKYNALPSGEKLKFYRENEKELKKFFF